jgi:hypothetical protein
MSDILNVDSEIDIIAKTILEEIEDATFKELTTSGYSKIISQLSDVEYTKKMLKHVEGVSIKGAECEIGKRALIKALMFSTWLGRLYFIVRSFLMAQIGLIVTLGTVYMLGTVNAFENFLIGIVAFIMGLFITRLFDSQITIITKKIVMILSRRRRVRDFIMKHF